MIVLGLGACTGTLREKVGEDGADASVLATIPPPACSPPATASDPAACNGGGKEGDDCLMCHHQGGGATPYTFAGTLYDSTGMTPLGGATITLQDSVGNVAMAISHAGTGNFYVADGYVMYPAKAFVSICPDVVEMVSPVDTQTGANCNTSGCHTRGFRVHLP